MAQPSLLSLEDPCPADTSASVYGYAGRKINWQLLRCTATQLHSWTRSQLQNPSPIMCYRRRLWTTTSVSKCKTVYCFRWRFWSSELVLEYTFQFSCLVYCLLFPITPRSNSFWSTFHALSTVLATAASRQRINGRLGDRSQSWCALGAVYLRGRHPFTLCNTRQAHSFDGWSLLPCISAVHTAWSP